MTDEKVKWIIRCWAIEALILLMYLLHPERWLLYVGILGALLSTWLGYHFLYKSAKDWNKKLEKIVRHRSWEDFLDDQLWKSESVREYIKEIVEGLIEQNIQKEASEVYDKHAQLIVLQSQINPHFLYNTLDSIRGQAIINGEKNIAAMLEALANFFRYSISRKENRVTFREEMVNMENYIKIQNYRFQGKFIVEVDESAKAGDIQDCIVPKLMLQPIVENAILHGLEQKKEGRVLIMADSTEDILLITVSDNGVGMSEEKLEQLNQALEQEHLNKNSKSTHGIALPNVHSRIRNLFGEEYGITVYSTEGKGTDVEILLPRSSGYQRNI